MLCSPSISAPLALVVMALATLPAGAQAEERWHGRGAPAPAGGNRGGGAPRPAPAPRQAPTPQGGGWGGMASAGRPQYAAPLRAPAPVTPAWHAAPQYGNAQRPAQGYGYGNAPRPVPGYGSGWRGAGATNAPAFGNRGTDQRRQGYGDQAVIDRGNNGARGYDGRDRYGRDGGGRGYAGGGYGAAYGGRGWDNGWHNDRRYDWVGWRERHRDIFHLGYYYPPYGGYAYARLDIGYLLAGEFLSEQYWIDDPYAYHLPPVWGPYRWVRYYNDCVLVDIDTGQVVDVVHNLFW